MVQKAETANSDAERNSNIEQDGVKQGFLKRSATKYVNFFKKPVKHVPESAGRVKRLINGLKERTANTKMIFLGNLNDPDIEVMKKDFNAVLFKWGIEEHEVVDAIRYYSSYLKGALIGALVLMAYFVISLFIPYKTAFFAQFAILSFGIGAMLVFLSCYWRVKVLKERKFEPFIEWILK